ncbi:hypothetical protein [Spiroplasma endosymbiont of Tipula paludosa]|uniref:hypothetical protein n=1 Tax=Spiroplasma endosymbiont of Tipula paludosa TaxID=3066295 RepID=UPI0035C91684
MKKLLAMLTTITSLSSITPIILANASEKAPENKIVDNEINYSQTSNLENLSRVKRGNNNFIENHYCFLCNNRLYVKISHRNWEKIRSEYNKRTRTSLYNFVYALLKNEFKKINSSGDDRSRDDFLNEDIEIIASVIYQRFSEIDEVFLNKISIYEGLIIRTNRDKYWENNDDFWGAHVNKENNGGEDLNDAIVNIQLGALNNEDDETILNALKEKNPDLLIDKLYVFVKNDSWAKIWVSKHKGLKEYQLGSWKAVFFTVRKDLSTVITNLNLGALNDNGVSTIKDAVKKLNPSLDVTEVGFSNITDTSADIEGWSRYNSNKYQGDKKVFFTVRKDLSTVITNLNLGALNDNGVSTIKDAVKKLNPSLDVTEVGFSNITDTSADIEGSPRYNSNKYQGDKKVTFTVRKDLSTVITNLNLGALNDNNKDAILNAVKAKNSILDASEVDVSAITDTSADIEGSPRYNSNKYQGYQKVTFTVRKDLSTVITNLNLGVLNDNSVSTIKDAVKKLNPSLDVTEVGFSNITDTSADIEGSPRYNSNKYQGDKKVFFTVRKDLFTVITNLNLGALNDNNKDAILNAVKAKNSILDASEVDVSAITDTSADIEGSPRYNSNKYQGYQKVTFTVRKDLSTVITNLNLGALNDNGVSTIKDAVKKLNPSLDVTEVGFSNITDTSADIEGSPRYNSNKYQGYQKVTFTAIQNLSTVITNLNLNVIDNSDKVILNELNYLNPDLDISQLEVVEKTNISAIIKEKKDSSKYFGEKRIYYTINNQQNKIIDLNELIKKAIFFKFRDDNPNLIFKEIKNINSNNLQYSNVQLKQQITPKFSFEKQSKGICFIRTIMKNDDDNESDFNTPQCSYEFSTETRYRITTGIIRIENLEIGNSESQESSFSYTSNQVKENNTSITLSNILENSDIKQNSQAQESSSSQTKNQSHGWNVEIGGKFLGIGASGGARGEYGSSESDGSSTSKSSSESNGSSTSKSSSESDGSSTSKSSSESNGSSTSKSSSQSISLSKNVNLDISGEKVDRTSSVMTFPSQKVTVAANSSRIITATLEEIKFQTTLNLEQDIYGNIQFDILTKNNETVHFDISIGQLMQKLIKYGTLPEEITVYEDGNSIFFNGKIEFSIKKGYNAEIVKGRNQPLENY